MYKAAIIFIRLLIPFALGIITAYNSAIPFYSLPCVCLVAAYLASDFLLRKNASLLFRFEWLLGVFLSFILFYNGGVYTRLYIENGRQNNFILSDNNPGDNFVLLKITEPLEFKEGYSKAFARVLASSHANVLSPSCSSILLYIPNDKRSYNLNYGDCILATNSIHEIPPPVNPGQFDVKSYYAKKNIYYSISLKAGEWQFTGVNKGNLFIKGIFTIRNKCSTIINRCISDEKERGVLSSLLIGDRDHLDPDLQEAFANTGVIHILAVSGMRIGLVYFIIISFFNVFDKRKKWLIIRVPVTILLIWSFTILTGSAGSAIRAAMMISFVIIGKSVNRQLQTLNLLAASAFLIVLIYGPLILFDTGFQLSFFAIIGITFFYGPILGLIEIENKLLFEAWRITGVSVAATIGTLPLAFYYFHRFPLYFILSNIIAVPLSILTIYSGVLMIISSPVPLINTIINKITSFLLSCLDGYINRINQLPFSSIHISYFPLMDLILCLLGITFIYLFFKHGRTLSLQLSLGCLILICLVGLWHNQVQRNQYSFTVFSFSGTNAIELKGNNNSVFISDSSVFTNKKSVKYFEDYWDNNLPAGISYADISKPSGNISAENANIFRLNNYFQVDSIKCIFINQQLPVHPPTKKLGVNYLLLINSPDIQISELQKFYSFNKIIFGSSNRPKALQNWINDCTRLKIPFYSVHDVGAFRLVW